MRIEMAVHVMNWCVNKNKMARVSAAVRSEFW